MSNAGATHRLCLSFLAASLLLTSPAADASTPSSPTSIISTATSSSSPSHPPSSANGQRKKKKRRRRSAHRDVLTPSSEVLSTSAGLGAEQAQGAGLQSEKHSVSLDERKYREWETSYPSEPLHMESNEGPASAFNPPSITVGIGESQPVKKRKKKRRRKAFNEVIRSNDEKVLLPMDDNESVEVEELIDNVVVEDDDPTWETECMKPIQSDSEETIRSEMEAELLPGELDGAGVLNIQEESPASTINVTRNETTETMTIHDDTNADSPATYEYSKHKEEETVDRTIRANSDDESMLSASVASEQGRRPATMAFVRSTQQRENIQISGGSTSHAVSVKVSRRRKHQTVHITTDRDDAGSAKKPSSSRPKRVAVATRGSGKGGECLRRVKREWKDAVEMGIAYDWANARAVGARPAQDKDYVRVGPFGRNLLRWHFSVSGPSHSAYEGGVYHGRVLLPRDYPGSPPRVQMLTPSGRFQCGVDICLSASSYHPETWTPRWTVLSLVDALRLHMLTTANEIGGVMASSERRREYAEQSRAWRSPGIVDHGRMVAEGAFPLHREEGGNSAEGDGEKASADLVRPSDTPLEGGGLPARSRSDLLDARMELDAPVRRATKASKTRTKTRNSREPKSPTDLRSETAKATKARSRPNAVATDTWKDDLQRSAILPTLLKRIVIETLKLPLRMISVLLQALIGLESRLRSILDSL